MISVIIPTYNRAHLIGRAIASVLAQSYQGFELIIIDDGSSDNTKEVVQGFGDERIRYLRHQENKGVASARNSGIKSAQGDYLAFLDSDDEWLPQKLEKQISLFVGTLDELGVVYCGVWMYSQKTQKLIDTMPVQVKGNAFTSTLRYVVLGGCSTPLIRKECFRKCGLFDEDLKSLEDWDMWIRIAKAYDFAYVNDCLVKRYIHGQQMTTSLKGKISARTRIIQKHFDDLVKHPKILSDHFNRLGILYAASGDLPQARRCFFNSLRRMPFQVFGYSQIIPLLLASKMYEKKVKESFVRKSIDGIPLYW